MATRKKPAPSNEKSGETSKLTVEKENQIYKGVFDEITRFTSLIARQEKEIQEAENRVAEIKVEFENAKDDLRELQQARDGSKHGLYRFLAPLKGEFMPLFDRIWSQLMRSCMARDRQNGERNRLPRWGFPCPRRSLSMQQTSFLLDSSRIESWPTQLRGSSRSTESHLEPLRRSPTR